MKPHSKFILLGLVLAGIFWGVWGWQRAKTPLPPLTKSLWYWHRPFLLKDEEVAQLRTAGVSEIFVHAGLLYRRDEDGTLGVTLGQSWKSRADGLKVHVVFNASADVLSRLEKLPEETLAETMASAARTQKQAAQKVGVEVIGLQCDLDFPTRLLLRYATLIKLLRSKLPGWQLSATLLSTWYTSHNLDAVLDALDFSVPQFYESQTPRGYADFTPIFSPRVLERGLATAGRRGKPFRAGLPAYGHALVFDGPGRLRGMYRDGGLTRSLLIPPFTVSAPRPILSRATGGWSSRRRRRVLWTSAFSSTCLPPSPCRKRWHSPWQIGHATAPDSFSFACQSRAKPRPYRFPRLPHS